jgi:hypothetical protein
VSRVTAMRLAACVAVGTMVLSVAAPAFAGPEARKPGPPKTVMDFFRLLPRDYFFSEDLGEQRMTRMAWLKRLPGRIIDIPNGYLHMPGDGAQQSLTLCLFRRLDGTYLAVVGDNHHEVFDPFLDFYEWRGGRLREVPRRSVLPVAYNSRLNYHLPRYGRTIRVADTQGRRQYDLVWDRRRFRLVRPAAVPASRRRSRR